MKSIKELRQINEVFMDRVIPYVLILKRTSMRQYPNGETVAMYYNDRLKQTITIPFKYNASGYNNGIVSLSMKENVIDSCEKLDDVEANLDTLTEPIKIRKRK